MVNFNGTTNITQFINGMTVEEFNKEKRYENRSTRLQVRVEPSVEDFLKRINTHFFPDLDFSDFHRHVLCEFVRNYMDSGEKGKDI